MTKLYYLMGASGAGKDTLLTQLKGLSEAPLLVAHRYITREQDAGGENHIALCEAEFTARVERDLFAMHWQANGHSYGIGCEIDLWLEMGCAVAVNGSRAYLECARSRYGERLVPVLIEVGSDELRRRLTVRGRESVAAIEARLLRAESLSRKCPVDICRIDSSGALNETLAQMLALLEKERGHGV